MKSEGKKTKAKTVADLEKEIQLLREETQALQKQLQVECGQCYGTGKPQVKTNNEVETEYEDNKETKRDKTKCTGCSGTGILGNRMWQIESNVDRFRKEVKRLSTNLSLHINKHSAELRVWVVDKETEKGKWQDYSGTFDLDSQEEESIVVDKARLHFETYFKDGVYHRNKKLGLFLSSGSTSGKRLIEEMETGD